MQKMKTLNKMLSDTPTLLSFVTVPTYAQEDINETYLKSAIIRRCGDCTPYYQKETDFQLFGALWFNSHNFIFKHALDVWNATYNPIENYNRYEEENTSGTRSETGARTDTHSGTDTITTGGTRSNTDTHSGTDTITTGGTKSNTDTHSGTDTVSDNVTRENEIAGFDSNSYSDANKETETGTHGTAHGHVITTAEQTSGSEATAHGHVVTTAEETSGSEATAHGHVIATDTETGEETENTRESHIHGNIGVTTSQQMIEAELELANKFWIYDYIASAFESDNFITCYNSYWEGEQWQ